MSFLCPARQAQILCFNDQNLMSRSLSNKIIRLTPSKAQRNKSTKNKKQLTYSTTNSQFTPSCQKFQRLKKNLQIKPLNLSKSLTETPQSSLKIQSSARHQRKTYIKCQYLENQPDQTSKIQQIWIGSRDKMTENNLTKVIENNNPSNQFNKVILKSGNRSIEVIGFFE